MAGRSFADRDDDLAAPPVMVINESMAKRYLSPRVEEAIGRTVTIAGGPARNKAFQVVGVVRDAKYNNLRVDARPMIYMPYAHLTRSLRALEVRSSLPAAAIAGPVRAALSEASREVMIRSVFPLSEQVASSLAAERLLLRLCVVFGGLALLLACVGIYGVIAYSVMQRTPEIGLRVALGATPGAVMRGVLRDTLVLVIAGVAVGIPAALFAGRSIASFLYGLTPRDPATLIGATAILLGAAIAAAALPAMRAARIDPNEALRRS